jgi:hypothetical protein
MNILLNLKQINTDYIFFREPIKNSIIDNGKFTRLIYSDSDMCLNGLHIYFDTNIVNQREMIDLLIELEKMIMFKIDILNKTGQYKIKDYLKFMNSKNYEDYKINKYVLKISGIWETNEDYGITFKFLSNK